MIMMIEAFKSDNPEYKYVGVTPMQAQLILDCFKAIPFDITKRSFENLEYQRNKSALMGEFELAAAFEDPEALLPLPLSEDRIREITHFVTMAEPDDHEIDAVEKLYYDFVSLGGQRQLDIEASLYYNKLPLLEVIPKDL